MGIHVLSASLPGQSGCHLLSHGDTSGKTWNLSCFSYSGNPACTEFYFLCNITCKINELASWRIILPSELLLQPLLSLRSRFLSLEGGQCPSLRGSPICYPSRALKTWLSS